MYVCKEREQLDSGDHFSNLQDVLAPSPIDFDVINISETSQVD